MILVIICNNVHIITYYKKEIIMAITVEDIFAAADQLLERGEKPTLAAIRKIVGGGSMTTLSEGFHKWRARAAALAALERVPIPDAVVKDNQVWLDQLWNMAQDAAQDRLDQERRALAEVRDKMEAETREISQVTDDLAAELDEVKASLAETRKENTELTEGLRIEHDPGCL